MIDPETLWLQISSGRGPSECQLAVVKLASAIEARARAARLNAEVIEVVAGEERGTALSALVKLSGPGAYDFARRWQGSVQWTAPSPFRPTHKRKNWFVGVELVGGLAEADAVRIDPRDVSFEFDVRVRRRRPARQQDRKRGAGNSSADGIGGGRARGAFAGDEQEAGARPASGPHRGRGAAATSAADKSRWQDDALERGKPVKVFKGPEFREVT